MRLDVGVIGAEELLRAVDRQLLDPVHDLAAAVVALSGKSFRVLVRERRAHRFEDGRRHEVLARDQLDPFVLAGDLLLDQAGDLRIAVAQRLARRTALPVGPGRHQGFSSVEVSVWASRSIFAMRRA